MALKKDDIIPVRQRKYLARDFDGLRSQILEYAKLYYPDRLRDFSEASLGGLLLDMAAYVGDNLSFYLDHQYSELNPESAVETVNIQRHLRTVGVPIVGASPAVVPATIYIQIPAATVGNKIMPRPDCIPVVQSGTVFTSDSGVDFILLEDIDFSKQRSDGSLYASVKVGTKASDGTPKTYIMAMAGLSVSGKETTDSFSIDSEFIPFRQLTLGNANVTDIINVIDSLGNIYYKVNALSHDVVYRNVINTAKDNDLVPEAIKVIPAPYRFIADTDLGTRKTTLTFGGGSADTLEDDIIPDPSEFAISFPYSRTFSRISVNPQQLLQTKTLGVAAASTTVTVTYRYGGGLSHNVPAGSIKTIKTLKMYFPSNPPGALAAGVKNTIEVSNAIQAAGGEDAPDSDELKALIPSIKNSQERIVTREDLLARVYTIPSNFGRVFRAAIRSNPNNPLATQLFIVSRSPEQKLITSPDTLKQNIVKYLNPYRMISDAIDVLDAKIINLTLAFEIVADPALNKSIVLQNILTKLQSTFNIKNFHIDQPLITSDVVNAIFSVPGVIAIDRVQFNNITGTVNNRSYSSATFNVSSNTKQGIILPPEGAIFEIRYPEVDIVGRISLDVQNIQSRQRHLHHQQSDQWCTVLQH